VCTTAPAVRSAFGTACLPRLRSTRTQGGTPQGDAGGVLGLGHRYVEISCNVFQAVPGLKAVNQVFDASSAMDNDRLAERLLRVHDDRR
jgi:hypothetical protein